MTISIRFNECNVIYHNSMDNQLETNQIHPRPIPQLNQEVLG